MLSHPAEVSMSRISNVLLALALAGGCGGGSGSVSYGAGVSVSTPDLVYAAPGVSVIADYDEPIFYSNGYYWWNYEGAWYRSPRYTGGWVYASPPVTISAIYNPHRYRRYRPSGYVSRYRRSRRPGSS